MSRDIAPNVHSIQHASDAVPPKAVLRRATPVCSEQAARAVSNARRAAPQPALPPPRAPPAVARRAAVAAQDDPEGVFAPSGLFPREMKPSKVRRQSSCRRQQNRPAPREGRAKWLAFPRWQRPAARRGEEGRKSSSTAVPGVQSEQACLPRRTGTRAPAARSRRQRPPAAGVKAGSKGIGIVTEGRQASRCARSWACQAHAHKVNKDREQPVIRKV